MLKWTNRITSITLAILICCSPEMMSAAAQERASLSDGQTSQPVTQQSESATQPDTSAPANEAAEPAPSEANRSEGLPDAPSASAQTTVPQSQTNNEQSQQTTEPAGTAAAQIGKLKGGPASKPAGAAIAPAKQHRTRSILLKFGALAGVGAALGTVYALSHGSPSRPPGAR